MNGGGISGRGRVLDRMGLESGRGLPVQGKLVFKA